MVSAPMSEVNVSNFYIPPDFGYNYVAARFLDAGHSRHNTVPAIDILQRHGYTLFIYSYINNLFCTILYRNVILSFYT